MDDQPLRGSRSPLSLRTLPLLMLWALLWTARGPLSAEPIAGSIAEPAAEGDSSVKGLSAWLDELTTEALSARLELSAARSSLSAARSALKASERWSNPRALYRYAPLPLETKRGETPHSFGLSQRLPAWGELEGERRLKEAQLRLQDRSLAVQAREVGFELKRALWELWGAERALERLDALEAWLQARAESVSAELSLGSAPLSALLTLKQRLELLSVRRLDLSAQVERARVDLGLALGRPEPFTGVVPSTLSELLKPISVTGPQRSAREGAQRPHSPVVERAARALEVAEAQSERLRASQRSQLELGLQWVVVQDQGGPSPMGRDALIAQIALTLPTWRASDRAALEASAAQASAARALRDRAEERWRAQLSLAEIKIRALNTQAERYEAQLLPQQRALIEAIEGEVSVNSAPLTRLLDAAAREEELATARDLLLTQLGVAWARWELLAGAPISSSQPTGAQYE